MVAAREERITFGTAPRVLEGALVVPASARAGGVVCHPHPQYGGDMDNAVVVATARALGAAGHAVLRFNFGGVGRSGGEYGGGTEEVRDVRGAVAALAARLPPATPLALVGYSFGAWVALRAAHEGERVERVVAIAPPLTFFDWDFVKMLALPVAVVVGDRDQYCPSSRLRALPACCAVHTLAGADHFLGGYEDDVAAAAAAACRPG